MVFSKVKKGLCPGPRFGCFHSSEVSRSFTVFADGIRLPNTVRGLSKKLKWLVTEENSSTLMIIYLFINPGQQ